jgi:hypothetical protein
MLELRMWKGVMNKGATKGTKCPAGDVVTCTVKKFRSSASNIAVVPWQLQSRALSAMRLLFSRLAHSQPETFERAITFNLPKHSAIKT